MSPNTFIETLYKYIRNEVGVSDHGIFDVVGFFNTVDSNGRYPDIEIMYVYFARGERIFLPAYIDEMLGLKEHIVQAILTANEESDVVIALHVLLNPKSKGRIELRSTDPFDAPRIHANYLSHYDDVETLIRGIRITQEFMRTTVFREHNAAVIPFDLPECDALEANSDAYYECYVRHMSNTLYHPTGTAKMGPTTDREAVVDARLRVHGIKNLRVADASIMPKIPSGHTNAPAIMIGEKAADMIKEDSG